MKNDLSRVQEILLDCFSKAALNRAGRVADYIPELSKVDPELFAISVTTVSGETYSVGDVESAFTLQSMSKPFVYALAVHDQTLEVVHKHVGVEPSGNAFNSIIELEEKSHRPYNPMINAGAIAVADLIKGKNLEEKYRRLRDFLSEFAGRKFEMSEAICKSESETAHRNRAILHLLRHFEIIKDPIDETLDLYFRQCSLLANIRDLSLMAATLANGGLNPITRRQVVPMQNVAPVTSLMFSCGMYDSVGDSASRVGIPAKSGVSGGIFGVVPGVMGIGVFSPRIDERGHSVRGVQVFEELSKALSLNIFSSRSDRQ